MDWRVKASVQNVVALLPDAYSYPVYYWLQRHFGGMRNYNSIRYIHAGLTTYDKIKQAGLSAKEGVFLEIGTGRRMNIPLTLWVLGAARIVTVDRNPYLKEELVRKDLNFISQNFTTIASILGNRIYQERLRALIKFNESPWKIGDLFKLCNIEYIPFCDASQLNISSGSIDFHISNDVLEHIPVKSLKGILKEGYRLIKEKGLFVHSIDYSDHFSHSDKSISAINFLQYSDKKWRHIAGNRFMYMNRLRVDDMCELVKEAGYKIIFFDSVRDEAARDMLRNHCIHLDNRFSRKSEKVLSTISSWIVAGKLSANNNLAELEATC